MVMGGMQMGKKLSDELCRENYCKLQELFDSVIEDSGRFKMVYAYGIDVGLTNAVVLLVSTSTYASYAVGYDTGANEIVILPVAMDLSGYGESIYLKKSEIKKAKQSFVSKEITIYDNRLPKKYIQLIVPEHINEDEDDVILLVKQNDEAKMFQQFFKNQYSR